jgi:hypothetical protein
VIGILGNCKVVEHSEPFVLIEMVVECKPQDEIIIEGLIQQELITPFIKLEDGILQVIHEEPNLRSIYPIDFKVQINLYHPKHIITDEI